MKTIKFRHWNNMYDITAVVEDDMGGNLRVKLVSSDPPGFLHEGATLVVSSERVVPVETPDLSPKIFQDFGR